MKANLYLFICMCIGFACTKQAYKIVTDNEYELVEEEKTLVKQTIKKVNKSDGRAVAVLTKYYNYNNDLRVKLLTGLTKEQGLSDFQLDSLYYDEQGNTIRKVNFLFKKGRWVKASILEKKYDDKQQLIYESKEGAKGILIVKNEKYHRYNLEGKLISTSEMECTPTTGCDSLSKVEYVYSTQEQPDTVFNYIWKEDNWKLVSE
ncbi:hypothetical protein [Sediminitomix flava]|uniref:Uncharacterized protein n=1 Tax=Sediminitomix flava TaxID=379075 RepID=A0A315Z8C1_SEDFL|nr:hypothetical protein [Sediminitomix flava]PWJ40805.1 hypothetical protein BC781_10464 [Sediminitomix flava]